MGTPNKDPKGKIGVETPAESARRALSGVSLNQMLQETITKQVTTILAMQENLAILFEGLGNGTEEKMNAINGQLTTVSNLILKHKEALESLKNIRVGIIAERIKCCDHPNESIRELPYQEDIFGTTASKRVCIKCGLAEEGWGCGHYMLKGEGYKILPISEEEFREYSRVYYPNDVLSDIRLGKIVDPNGILLAEKRKRAG